MPRAQSIVNRLVRAPDQQLYLNGNRTHRAICRTITRGHGLRPAEAIIQLPYNLLGDDLTPYLDAEVILYANDTRDPTDGAPAFRGYITGRAAREDANTNQTYLRASSPLAFLDRVYVGQKNQRAITLYPQRDRITGNLNNYRISTIITDLFDPLEFPDEWANIIQLGDLSGLHTLAAVDIELPDIAFPCIDYLAALRHLLQFAPSVGIAEEFTHDRTILNFYAYGASLGRRTITIPSENTQPEDGATATAIVAEHDIVQINTRVIGHGRPGETMLTVSTQGENEAALEPVWTGRDDPDNPPFQYPTTYPTYTPPHLDEHGDPVPGDFISPTELQVLADPSLAVPGSATFTSLHAGHFRRYRLPACLRRLRVLADNCLEDTTTTGRRMRIQFFKPALEWTGTPYAVGSTAIESPTDYVLIDGANITDDGYITLAEPNLECFGQTQGEDGVMRQDMRPVALFVTLTVQELTAAGCIYDTGNRGTPTLQDLTTEGTVHSFIAPDCRKQKIASDLEEFDGHTFDCTYYDALATAWITVDTGPSILRDDTPFLQNLCEQTLAERSIRRTAATITLPETRIGYQIGEALTILNRNIDDKRLTIHNIAIDLIRPRTVISASDQIPWSDNTTLRANPRSNQAAPRGHVAIAADPTYTNPPGGSTNTPPLGPVSIASGLPASNQPPTPEFIARSRVDQFKRNPLDLSPLMSH